MFDDFDITIPDEIPVMVLSDTVLFPHAILPLYIFEQRYRDMLSATLASHRLFAVFQKHPDSGEEDDVPVSIGTVGVIRASHENSDGTSNLVIQGISRVRLIARTQDEPYPLIKVRTLDEETELTTFQKEKDSIVSLMRAYPTIKNNVPDDYLDFLQSINEPSIFIDVSAFAVVNRTAIRQQILETTSLSKRFELFKGFLLGEIEKHSFYRKLQGQTKDEEINLN